MTVRVLVLRGRFNQYHKYEKWLVEAGYTIQVLEDFNRSLLEIAAGDCEGMIYFGTMIDAGHFAFCRELQQKFPFFPILQMIEKDETAKDLCLRRDLFHELVADGISRGALLIRIQRLVYMGSLRRRLIEGEYLSARIDHHLGQVNPTNSIEVVTRAAEFMAELTGSENVIWMSTAFVEQQTNGKVNQLGDSSDPKWASQRILFAQSGHFVLKPLHISPTIAHLAEHLKASKASISFHESNEISPSQNEQVFKIPDEKTWIVILKNHLSQENLGYFLLIKPRLIPSGLLRVLHVVENRLTYALIFESARQTSYLDDLTNLYNQRYLPLVLTQEMNRSEREGRKLSVLFLDVDFFKSVNDNNGHLVGSQVLVQIGDVLRNCTRGYDYIFRYGGDEFVVILPSTNVDEAREVAERVRQQVELSTFVVNGSKVHLTVSIGIATFPDHAKTSEQILQLADRAMYYGKHVSRNIVYIAS